MMDTTLDRRSDFNQTPRMDIPDPKPPKRSYSARTIKILFALSGNQCAEPSCRQPLIKPGTVQSDPLVVAQIAHIYAVSVDGPRGKKGLTESELNGASNLILLCPTHHVVVDGQHETYPAELLKKWKSDHERRWTQALGDSVGRVGFAELEVAANALIATGPGDANGFSVIAPAEKIRRNGLGMSSELLLTMGAAKSAEVAAVLIQASKLDSGFPERLKTGFQSRYLAAKSGGATGDALFAELYDWASGSVFDPTRAAAGLCILAHLFILCDVFEK